MVAGEQQVDNVLIYLITTTARKEIVMKKIDSRDRQHGGIVDDGDGTGSDHVFIESVSCIKIIEADGSESTADLSVTYFVTNKNR